MKKKKKAKINYFKIVGISLTVILGLTVVSTELENNFIKKETQFPEKYEKIVEKYSKEYNVDKYFVYAVIKQESNFRSDAVSRAGARGLMQITQDTFNWLSVKMQVDHYTYDDLFEPEINIMYGVFFLSYLQDRFENIQTIAAAYNAGMNITRRWLKDEKYSDDGVTLKNIPYGETAHYVEIVKENYDKYKQLYEN